MNKITETEARTIALLRLHFKCSISKLATCCEGLWDAERCQEITGHKYGSEMGAGLVMAMEDFYELERGESDNMSFGEQICFSCGKSQQAISSTRDLPKECGHCGKISSMWKP